MSEDSNEPSIWLELFRRFQRELQDQIEQSESTDSSWNFWGSEPSQILDFLFIGSKNTSSLENLKRKQIKSVVNCCALDWKPKYPLFISAIYFRAPDHKNYDISQHFEESYQFIEKARERGEKVLVHCVAGVSRSASIVIAYCMRKFNWDFFTAYAFVASKRPAVDPNEGFLFRLRAFEQRLKAHNQKLIQ